MEELVSIKRNILAHSPSTGKVIFETIARTVGELKEDLNRHGFNLDVNFKEDDRGHKIEHTYKITEGQTQVTFEGDNALLPTNIMYEGRVTNDLLILVTPIKIDHGILPYKEIKRTLKEIFEAVPSFKEHIRDNRGNWTQFTTEQLNQILDEYNNNWSSGNVKEESCEEPCRECSEGHREKKNKFSQEYAMELITEGISLINTGISVLSSLLNLKSIIHISNKDLGKIIEEINGKQ